MGRGPGSPDVRDDRMEHEPPDRDEDWREERDRDSRERDDERGGLDPRDVFMRDPDLPHDRERELIYDRDREYTLNGSDTRARSTIGAFRVVPESSAWRPLVARSVPRCYESQPASLD